MICAGESDTNHALACLVVRLSLSVEGACGVYYSLKVYANGEVENGQCLQVMCALYAMPRLHEVCVCTRF